MDKNLNEDLSNKDMPYDLRQVYAVDILGEHLKDIARARKADNYYIYFKCLKDLFIITQFKWKDKKINVIENKEKKEVKALEHWDFLFKAAVEVCNTNRNEFLGESKEPRKRAMVETALNNLEQFIYEMIDTANMFGGIQEDEDEL